MSLTPPKRLRFSVRPPRFRFRYALVALVIAIALGTLGFKLIEGWSIEDSLYMTVMTVTTVGYGEVHPLSQAGRWFNLPFMLFGVATVLYALTTAVQSIVQ